MPAPTVIAGTSLLIVLVLMLAEQRLSAANARRLLRLGAVEGRDEAYRIVQWVYPLCFTVMAAEGMLRGPEPGWTTWSGAVVLVLAKALKAWVIVSLGPRWTYRLMVLPGVPLVTTGPYAWLRHPNYVAVVAELAGLALLVGAALSGPVAVLVDSGLLRRRIQAENRALRAVDVSKVDR